MSMTDNIVILVITAGLTGVLVPAIKALIDAIGQRMQARLARQDAVLESQTQLLERLAELLWRYWKLALEVAYYGRLTDKESREKYHHAREQYDSEQSWETGRNIHIEVSKARRLIPSPNVYSKLDALRTTVVDDIDTRLTNTSDSPREWNRLYEYLNGHVRRDVDSALLDVAQNLHLSALNEETHRRLTPT